MAKKVSKLERDIRIGLRERVDPEYLIGIQRLVPGVRAIGVRVPQIRALVREVHLTHAPAVEDAVALMHAFAKTRGREEMLAGIFLIARFKRELDALAWSDIDAWVSAIDNWEVCDQLALNIAGEKLARDLDGIEHLLGWARSENAWRRRFAIACTVPLNQKGRSHPHETARVLEKVNGEREPIVKKAIAWARREANPCPPD
jgi:3-methyladenine DNA glycosylase AlkD